MTFQFGVRCYPLDWEGGAKCHPARACGLPLAAAILLALVHTGVGAFFLLGRHVVSVHPPAINAGLVTLVVGVVVAAHCELLFQFHRTAPIFWSAAAFTCDGFVRLQET